jgi:hypothetical protein
VALDLTGCRARIERANECLADYKTACQTWVKDEADKIVHENRPDTRQYQIICKKTPIPPVRLATLVGDTIHCFRSCLDLLVYAVAVHESNQEPPPNASSLAFPAVATDEADFDAKWANRLQHLSIEARAVIENLQPFREVPPGFPPKDWVSWLSALDKLDNIYKHRRLGVIAMQPGGEVLLGAGSEELAIIGIGPPGPLKDNTVLLDCKTNGNPDVKMEYDATFSVGFNEPDIFPKHYDVLDILVLLGDNTWQVVNRLRDVC